MGTGQKKDGGKYSEINGLARLWPSNLKILQSLVQARQCDWDWNDALHKLMWRKGTMYFTNQTQQQVFSSSQRRGSGWNTWLVWFADNAKSNPSKESLSSRRCAPRRIWCYWQLAACNIRLLQAFHSHKQTVVWLRILRHGDMTSYKEMKICSAYVLHQIGN